MEESSARVAQLLLDHGFYSVNALRGGLDAWINAGYPVDKSSP
jgi:rhodanese-related sulfurtransferase